MDYLILAGTVSLIHFLAVMSPGPDFVMAIRNTLTYSKEVGIWTAVGFGLGIAVHVIYSLAGVAVIISQSIIIFNTIKILGSFYLIYIGLKSILSKSSQINLEQELEKNKKMSKKQAIKVGFLTNVLNPKATLFFLSLFTIVISPETPFFVTSILGLLMVFQTILWFSLVAIFLSQKNIRGIYEKYQNLFVKIFGSALVFLGIKIALSKK